jgi:FPC/CPF motif-containing protein YcgG
MSANLPPRAGRPFSEQAKAAFRELVLGPEFPCLGAKAAVNSGSAKLNIFDELGSARSTHELAAALAAFTSSVVRDSVEPHVPDYASFVAIFERPRQTNEIEFERLLWRQLRLLHEHDANGSDWDDRVASDPADPHFSFSFAGRALYVIGMHANSSRAARRFPWPMLVFNPHEQFERLRSDGNWKRMQESIRQRDLELQGSINPMLSDFGEQSEARQYSGRAVEEDWRAPFPKIAGKCPFAH